MKTSLTELEIFALSLAFNACLGALAVLPSYFYAIQDAQIACLCLFMCLVPSNIPLLAVVFSDGARK